MMWQCSICGYIHEDELPEKCPKCGAPKEKFTKLEEQEESLIKKARLTNDIHMRIEGMLKDVNALAEIGIMERLDAPCVAIFERAKKDSTELVQSIKAEIATHVSKKKWG